MAKVILKQNPSLTKEKLKEILAAHYGPLGYEVDFSKLIGADIYIKKNGWVGVTIKLKQTTNSTFLRMGGYAPSLAVRLLLYGLITFIILAPKWNWFVKEVSNFVTSEEFNRS
jgi:hypothetical protein